MFEALAQAGINIEMISTSEIKLSVVIDLEKGEPAMRAVHAAFLGEELA
jgi:aspartate kinase